MTRSDQPAADHPGVSSGRARPGSERQPKTTHRGAEPTDLAAPLRVTGTGCVVLGGVIAAVTGPLDLGHGSWLAAYLVLVGGVTQYAMGEARARHPGFTQRVAWVRTQFGGWNLGNALVITGTLVGDARLVDLGSVLLVAALALAGHASRRAARSSGARAKMTLFDGAYRAWLIVLAASIPVGIVLSYLRHP